jgi:hypothetical protein
MPSLFADTDPAHAPDDEQPASGSDRDGMGEAPRQAAGAHGIRLENAAAANALPANVGSAQNGVDSRCFIALLPQ